MNFWVPNVPLFTSTSQSVFLCAITEVLQHVHIFCVKGELEGKGKREQNVRVCAWVCVAGGRGAGGRQEEGDTLD